MITLSIPTPAVGAAPTLPTVILSLAWREYLRKLESDPLLTKSITSAVLSVLSELLAKRLTKHPVRSSAAFNELTIGLILRGPVIHYFHTFLDRVIFPSTTSTPDVKVVILKMLIDQFLFAPLFTALYYYVRGLAQDRSIGTTTKQLRRDLPGIMKKNWSVWIPVNLINYSVVPLQQRVLFGSLVGVFWNAYVIVRAAQVGDPAS